ncbi:phosphomannose isomerase type II C-terminal cupin domain [Rhizobium rhizogenes]|uniref:phosphomannose isomerase type II C-terminal cupin domain n=1 Tax=Rhizobium rhizogenes TaxID=359 RepID=UPI001F21D54D|nr:phosphomannose isomerase type II C-terminal cupin domain [Rhizobium rhizogenes]
MSASAKKPCFAGAAELIPRIIFGRSTVDRLLRGNSLKSGSFYKIGDNDQRPWGTWHVLDIGDRHVVKRIVVNPGERLSLQYHNHRSERWTAVSGRGIAEIDGTEHVLQLGHTVNIPLKATHRASCTSDTPLVFIEIQYGELLDENDIIRISDDYNRV